jgi:chromosome segregation ATPase
LKIKRIEICGFKSFVDKTTISFPDPITSIVGPNGCGKSNVVDAIRWVMGEQSAKHLRGRAMEGRDLRGSESRGPAGLAEVSLTFDASGLDSGAAPGGVPVGRGGARGDRGDAPALPRRQQRVPAQRRSVALA